MAGSSNFLIHDETMTGIMSDQNYSLSGARMNGVANGIADPTHFNKAMHQATIMSAALAQIASNLGYTASDADVNALIQTIQSAFSTTPYAKNAANAGNIINQAFKGTADFGEILLCQKQPMPAAPVLTVGSSGTLSGTYRYIVTLLTGFVNADGSITVTGLAPGSESQSIAASNQSIQLTGIPTGTSGTVGRAIYRTIAGGSSGTEKLCAIISDNTTTTYTDSNADSGLGNANAGVTINGSIPSTVPGSNTTGSFFYYDAFNAVLQSNWANMSSYYPAAYRKDSMGNVHLRGVVQGGVIRPMSQRTESVWLETIFMLPPNYRPAYDCCFGVGSGSDSAPGEIVVGADGNVFANHPVNSTAWSYLSLDNIIFPTY